MDSAAQAIERIKAVARLLLAAALGLAYLLTPPRRTPLYALVGFVFGVYFVYALVALIFRRKLTGWVWPATAVAGDGAVLVVVVLLAPNLPAAFLLFFVYFTLVAGLWRGWRAAVALSVLVSAAHLWVAWKEAAPEAGATLAGTLPRESWLVVGGLLVAGGLVGAVAHRERGRIERAAEVERYAALLSLDLGWPELWRRWLAELCQRYRAGRALLTFRNPENDRVLLWEFRSGEPGGALAESDRPPRDTSEFLLDAEAASLLANRLEGGGGQQVSRGDSSQGAAKPGLPPRFSREFSPNSLLSVPVSVGGTWGARLFLLDAAGGFTPGQLEDLRELVERLGPVLTNLLTIRSLITAAVDQERERIVRELHDGVAQTLASVEMQLNVYRRLAVQDPARTGEELGGLQAVVKQEQEELRRFLRTLKPVRVAADELGRWMLAHCAQFQQETGIEVDVWADPLGPSLPEGVCREVFQILREALHNVRKHAKAQHVLVRLRQDGSWLRLLVDDDGCGFSFTGTYSQRALEEQGLLPVSIGERTRALGGTLTIDSTPGSGATLRVDIPLS
ncbi:MAG: sensor histidine kinase [Acidobacteria bacterium]|nr:sensor histidine kinase [Acidobacteriota bacterium]